MDQQQPTTVSTPTPDPITPVATTPTVASATNNDTNTIGIGADTNGAGAPTRRWLNENVTPALLEGMKLLAKEKYY